MSFRIIDPVTGLRQSQLSWPPIGSARAAIAEWRVRTERGGRPDIPIERIDRLIIETDCPEVTS